MVIFIYVSSTEENDVNANDQQTNQFEQEEQTAKQEAARNAKEQEERNQ